LCVFVVFCSINLYVFFLVFLFQRFLYSFPTRRSSDLSCKPHPPFFRGCYSLRQQERGTPLFFMAHFLFQYQRVPCFLKLVKKLQDRKSTRLNSSHVKNSYAVFCLKKKICKYSHI